MGRLSEYKPWLHIQDVPSKGLSSRVRGWKTGRVHHLLSLLELTDFYVLEWSLDVTDVREQFPLLPLEETLAIAQSCGIRHPADPKTKHPVVMTTDFINTVRRGPVDFDESRTVKYKSDLLKQRTLEKLEIERRYWEARKIRLKVVTEDGIPAALAKNVEWLHSEFVMRP
ncbi:MAG: TnsA endonuclease N-terminal domain-containing protein [Acidobacteria bacterium]|nr:TnsA endonuclease N-terminal domain-containing protein [Acidobacteriota bacterium]